MGFSCLLKKKWSDIVELVQNLFSFCRQVTEAGGKKIEFSFEAFLVRYENWTVIKILLLWSLAVSIFSVMYTTQTAGTSTICNYCYYLLWGLCFDLYWSFTGLKICSMRGNQWASLWQLCVWRTSAETKRFALNSYVILSSRGEPFTENNCKYEAIQWHLNS